MGRMATLQERLSSAETAYDDLLAGKAVAEFRDANGESVRYNRADLKALAAHIQSLRNEIAAAAGTSATPYPGPMRSYFV